MKKFTLLVVILMGIIVSRCTLTSNDEEDTPVPQTIPATTAATTPAPTATPTPGPTQPAATQPTGTGVGYIYLIALEDNGASGTPVGCNDSLIPVWRGDPAPTETFRQIAYALGDLLSLHDQFYGESGFYNALYQSNLTVQNVNVDANGHATIDLSGELLLGGVCDNPRVQAQLEQTVLQFSVTGVTINVNGTPLDDLLSGQ